MSNYRLTRSVCISTKLAQIKPYSKKVTLIDAIMPLNYTVKLCMILIIKFVHTNTPYKAVNSKKNRYVLLFMLLAPKYCF